MRKGAAVTILLLNLILLPVASAFTQARPAAKSLFKGNPFSDAAAGSDSGPVLTLEDAVALALKQASNYKTAQINELISAEDIRQARAAFYPVIAAKPNVIYTTPSFSIPAGTTQRPASFLGANAISEFQGLVTAAGEIDTSGKLKAALKRNEFLLAAAKAGSLVARRELTQAVVDAYFNLALATTKRRGAENNLQTASDFENNIKLQLDAGEVAPVDLVRARLQAAARRDELAQTQADESINAAALKFLIGYEFTTPVTTIELLSLVPTDGELDQYTETAIHTRPEYAQFEAQLRAAEQDVKFARAERRPQINYGVRTGFISDSLRPNRVKNSTGAEVTFGVNIPLFDRGASKSRETQARLRIQQTENAKQLAERTFLQAFYTARTQAMFAANRIKQIRLSIADAELNVSASLARYRSGEASIIEVTDAQNTLVTQRQSLYQAIFDYQTARAHLLHAIGQ